MTLQEQREREWSERVARQAASGLSARAWCAREGINYAGFRRWRQRLSEAPRPSALTLVQIAGEPAAGCGLVIAVGAARIEVRPDVDAALLRRVVEALSP